MVVSHYLVEIELRTSRRVVSALNRWAISPAPGPHFLIGATTWDEHVQTITQISTCVSLAKNPLSCVLSHVCFSRTSSLLYLLQWNVPSQVCLSLSPVSTSGKHSFTCLPQQNTIWHNWISKEPLSLYFKVEQPSQQFQRRLPQTAQQANRERHG